MLLQHLCACVCMCVAHICMSLTPITCGYQDYVAGVPSVTKFNPGLDKPLKGNKAIYFLSFLNIELLAKDEMSAHKHTQWVLW